MADLIDPMNEDTYDDRVIVHGPLKSKIATEAYRRGWEKAFGKKINIKINRRKLCLIKSREHFSIISMTNSINELSTC